MELADAPSAALQQQAPPGWWAGCTGARLHVSQVDIVSHGGEKIAVSVWMKKVRQEHRLCCVVVLEPVERVSAWVSFQNDVSLQHPVCRYRPL